MDILAAFKKIDEDRPKLDTPLFVARRLDRLPRHGPEEISVSSLGDIITKMEYGLAAIRVDVNRVKDSSQINSFATVAAILPASSPVTDQSTQPPSARLQQRQQQQQRQQGQPQRERVAAAAAAAKPIQATCTIVKDIMGDNRVKIFDIIKSLMRRPA